ncbi:hypothetical protein ACQW5G_03225 [Fructilactobacillus sp. Tb1]|uniref:hypothetical protein n=1 Tax=Fructilactobacillus sp. Tb1 TaxID=3422304 RepID=UPI003D266EF3
MLQKFIPAISNTLVAQQASKNGLPLSYVSPRLLANQFLGSDNQGLLSISEYARFFRYISIESETNLIADLQAGFGNQLNTYFAGKELGARGAKIIMLNDQKYPAHSNTPHQFASLPELLGKLEALKDSQTEYGAEIWLKLDGLQFYDLTEFNRRLELAHQLGINQIVIGHLDRFSYQLLKNHPHLSDFIISQDNDEIPLIKLAELNCQSIIPDYETMQNLKFNLKEYDHEICQESLEI